MLVITRGLFTAPNRGIFQNIAGDSRPKATASRCPRAPAAAPRRADESVESGEKVLSVRETSTAKTSQMKVRYGII